MKNIRLVILVVVLLVGGLVAGNISYAESAKDFYKGKVIKFVVQAGPGGGSDVFTRLVAEYLPRYTESTIVVANIVQAGGIQAYNHVYTTKPNGLTISITDTPALVMGNLFKLGGVRYDYRKFNWLGRISWDERTILVAKDSPYRTVKDLMAAKELKASNTGKLSPGCTVLLVAHALGMGPKQIKPIIGYHSGKEMMLAVMQKEVDMTSLSASTAYGFVKAGLVKAVCGADKERSKFFPDIPPIWEEVKIPEKRGKPLAIYLNMAQLKRGVITTPGVPQERVDFLRDALGKCLADKDLLAKAAKIDRLIRPLSRAEMEKRIKDITALSEEEIKELKHVIVEKYY